MLRGAEGERIVLEVKRLAICKAKKVTLLPGIYCLRYVGSNIGLKMFLRIFRFGGLL